MPIFELRPKHLDAPEWKMSTRCLCVRLEARDAVHARELAERQFAVPAAFDPDLRTVFHPWWNPGLVEVEEIQVIDVSSESMRGQTRTSFVESTLPASQGAESTACSQGEISGEAGRSIPDPEQQFHGVWQAFKRWGPWNWWRRLPVLSSSARRAG